MCEGVQWGRGEPGLPQWPPQVSAAAASDGALVGRPQNDIASAVHAGPQLISQHGNFGTALT